MSKMKWNDADGYTNIVTEINIDDSDNDYNQKITLQYLKLKCPKCENEGWIYQGNVNDNSKTFIENAQCNACNHEFFLTYFDEWANNGNFCIDPEVMEDKNNFPRLNNFQSPGQ